MDYSVLFERYGGGFKWPEDDEPKGKTKVKNKSKTNPFLLGNQKVGGKKPFMSLFEDNSNNEVLEYKKKYEGLISLL